MILYTRELDTFKGYNQRYSENSKLFEIYANAQKFLDQIISLMKFNFPVSVLEVGCGQGDYLALFKEKLISHNLIHQDSRFIGLDGSTAAIKQCEEKYPEQLWIGDSVQKFLLDPRASQFDNNIDILMNKGGTTFIEDEEECREILTNKKRLLKPGGIFCWFISKSFYDDSWIKKTSMKDWNKDFMSLAKEVFPVYTVFDNPGVYAIIFHNI
ncbi:class I SAM-dependent methyltransferase [Capilliphycus salinus ALCB114379]|uniref:class I SAM-dependent methyltransferase n=1 Tax=Capilliphycus salinus TaxID=2768948 RepID=UPI0039A51FD1